MTDNPSDNVECDASGPRIARLAQGARVQREMPRMPIPMGAPVTEATSGPTFAPMELAEVDRVLAELRASLATPYNASRGEGWLKLRIERIDRSFPWAWFAGGLVLLVLLLPTRRVRVKIDPQARTIHVRDQS